MSETQTEGSAFVADLDYEGAVLAMTDGKFVKSTESEDLFFMDPLQEVIMSIDEDNNISQADVDVIELYEDWGVVEPSDEQKDAIDNYYSAKNDKAQRDSYNALEAVAYNHGFGTSFIKLGSQIAMQDLEGRVGIPPHIPTYAQFLMDNGQVFNFEQSRLTILTDLLSLDIINNG